MPKKREKERKKNWKTVSHTQTHSLTVPTRRQWQSHIWSVAASEWQAARNRLCSDASLPLKTWNAVRHKKQIIASVICRRLWNRPPSLHTHTHTHHNYSDSQPSHRSTSVRFCYEETLARVITSKPRRERKTHASLLSLPQFRVLGFSCC